MKKIPMTNNVFDIRLKCILNSNISTFLCRGMNKINDPKKQHECISIKKIIAISENDFPKLALSLECKRLLITIMVSVSSRNLVDTIFIDVIA